MILIGATVLLAITGLATGLFMALRTVVRPLHELRAAMGSLAEGQTDAVIPHGARDDEVGEMARSMAAFRDQLAQAEQAKAAQTTLIVDSIGRGLSSLAQGNLTARIDAPLDEPFARLKADFNGAMEALEAALALVADAAGGIRAGSMDIRQASDDLSQRTEQQAASSRKPRRRSRRSPLPSAMPPAARRRRRARSNGPGTMRATAVQWSTAPARRWAGSSRPRPKSPRSSA